MAPRYWYRPPGALMRLLAPLAPGRPVRRGAPARLSVPAVAVGSLSLGGTGKTPTVIAIAQRLMDKGRAVHVVAPGEGIPFRVDERGHDAEDVGNEPLLIAAFAPTWVARDLAEGARAAIADGAEVVVLDGGFPEREIAVDVTVLAEDAVRGFGNGFAWPLGPLKRPIGRGLRGVDLVIAIGPPAAQDAFAAQWGAALPCPIASARLAPLPTGMEWDGLDVVAFAGIGAPERFFATLRALGANVLRTQALSDHQELTSTLLTRLLAEAKARGAQLVTTEKDAVRLPRKHRQAVISLPVRLELADWRTLDARLP